MNHEQAEKVIRELDRNTESGGTAMLGRALQDVYDHESGEKSFNDVALEDVINYWREAYAINALVEEAQARGAELTDRDIDVIFMGGIYNDGLSAARRRAEDINANG